MKRVLLIFAVLLFTNSCNVSENTSKNSEPQNITTKYTELKKIISTEVGDTFYVYIRVPKKYADKNDHYPVLYLLDGDIDFNMATSIVRYLQYGNEAPDLII
ncbi:MAG: hypothetical protein KDC67_11380, partial [Ignavibacteriae bacterium]|nr:hypothetical protein [Ignavibacteriota bacterium]